MDFCDRLDPVIHEDEFIEVSELLFCHGLHKDLPHLLDRVSRRCPQILELSFPHKHVLSLLAYCQKLQREGPLPAIRDPLFMHTLHEGVVGILKSEDQLVEAMTSEHTLRLVVGLRSLLTRSLLHDKKFTVKDIERTVASFFPILPVRPSNSQYWDSWARILKIDLEEKPECDVLTMANRINKTSEKHFRDKLDNLAVERRKITVDESILVIWRTFEDKFSDFVRHLKDLLPSNFLMKLVESSHPKLKLTTVKLSPESDEQEVIEYFDYVCDLYMESNFWSCNFVTKKISENDFSTT